jgi:ribosome-binding ATPase YchF (GTP1/OBG family)
MAVAASRLERLGREVGKRTAAELAAERSALEPCRAALDAGMPLRQLEFTHEQRRILKGFTFLTLKPLLVVLNAGEEVAGDLAGAVTRAGLDPWQHQPHVVVSAVCATIEQEIARLAPDDQAAFLTDLGLPDRALDRVLRAAFDLLGLISFFTLNDAECRAWPVSAGTPAVKAAGTIHSDLERGFIRAEVVRWQELVEAGSLAACRAHATLRLEGKDYVVQDGDVVLVRFHV